MSSDIERCRSSRLCARCRASTIYSHPAFSLNTERFTYDIAAGETHSLVFPPTFTPLLTLCVAHIVSIDSHSTYKYLKPSRAETQETVAPSLHLRLRAFRTTAAHSFPSLFATLLRALPTFARPSSTLISPSTLVKSLQTRASRSPPSSANRPPSDHISLAPVVRPSGPQLVDHVGGGIIFQTQLYYIAKLVV